ncbi:HAMP domain-containing sensor histidine kinase [Intrasporangium sp. DVR]|uniref:sensor histidine kinase n=1 Tax=Intrasporangium sp. DVR TaxID=3127867 RepID=UPI00333EAE4C
MTTRVRPLSTWTLRAKLMASMLALFTVLSLATAAFTVAALNQQLVAQVDEQLRDTLHAPRMMDGNMRRGGPGADSLIAQYTPGSAVGWVLAPERDVKLGSSALAAISAADLGSTAETVDLGALGRFRMMAQAVNLPSGNELIPVTLVVGLSMAPTDATIARMVLIAASSVAAGVLLVGGIGTWIVRRSLEPLRRVADTASRVSRMPLHAGQVQLVERVAPADTDTRTEVGQVGAAFNEMLDHVDEALNARHRSEQRVRQFVADASHELRTPLASIKGYAELSRREPESLTDTVSHAMGRIESEAGRMGSLVEDLLLLARLDAGRPLASEPVDMSMLVVNAVSDAHAAAPEHRWDLDLPPDPVEVRGDSARLHQVVANLLANARTHTPPGTHVTTSVRPDGDLVRISVHDDGPGIPEALQPNVFERFARGDSARNRAGGSTGLGLSIVAAVTRAHGGRVELASRPGDTTIAVLLPAA